ncbi:hypothetical protein [Propioniciclava soli]|uniref:Integral membrane protein n=1 Tax=Propioniciclava soli TaxID=2775081 RepID=A0ABZ3C3T0_9ACTN|nr:hypothetical protein [Propioniciclava soli]
MTTPASTTPPDPGPARRPASALVAGGATLALGVFFVVLALLALTSGHGEFSGHVAVGLAVWGAVVVGLGIAWLRRAWWSRGPVVAAGLLHLLAFGQSTLVQPWAVLGAAAGLAAVVGALWPAVTPLVERRRGSRPRNR